MYPENNENVEGRTCDGDDLNYFKDMEKAFDFMGSNPNWKDLKKNYTINYNRHKEDVSLSFYGSWWEKLNIQIVITKKNNDHYEGKIINKGYPWYDIKKNDLVKFSIDQNK